MKHLKSHFVFTRGQRNGIFLLVLLIICLQLLYFSVRYAPGPVPHEEENEEVVKFRQKLDSLKEVAARADSVSTRPFNPNLISDYRGYILGMSVEEIDRLHHFRAGDKWVNSAEEFQAVTGVSDSLLKVISPHFRFPEWVQDSSAPQKAKSNVPVAVTEQRDLNQASAAELMEVPGVGEVLSQRIVSYRSRIGGFRSSLQLKDVYGLKPDVISRIRQYFEVPDRDQFIKSDLNSIEVIPLSELPYFNYELAREVVNYRKLRGEVQSFRELEDIKGFPVEKIDRIQLYLTIN